MMTTDAEAARTGNEGLRGSEQELPATRAGSTLVLR